MNTPDWLVRTASLKVLGPFQKEKLIEMIQGGEIIAQDEICRGNHFWFFIHEGEELQKQLGIAPPLSPTKGETEEITETDLQKRRAQTGELSKQGFSRIPGQILSPLAQTTAAHETTVMFQSSIQIETPSDNKSSTSVPTDSETQTETQTVPATAPRVPRNRNPIVASQVERPAIFKSLVSFLILASAVLIWLMLRMLSRT